MGGDNNGGGGGLGSLSSLGNAVGTYIGGVPGIVGNAIGGDVGKYIGGVPGFAGNQIKNLTAPQPDAPTPPGMDPRLAAIRDKQIKESQDFTNNLDAEKDQTFKNVESAQRGQLNNDLGTINKNYNRRGLLYSGMREGSQAGAQASSAAGLAQARLGINTSLEQQADNMQKQAISGGMDYWQGAKAIQDSAYNAAMQQMASRRSAIGGLMGAGGAVAGAGIAGSNQKSPTPPPPGTLQNY